MPRWERVLNIFLILLQLTGAIVLGWTIGEWTIDRYIVELPPSQCITADKEI